VLSGPLPMNTPLVTPLDPSLRLEQHDDTALSLHFGDLELFRYVYRSDAYPEEAPRPYFHPLRSLEGDVMTNFRPNNHPWHHGLSLTMNNVSGANFWGGPSYHEDGYQWRGDWGRQSHVEWRVQEASGNRARLEEVLEWTHHDEVIFREERRIGIAVNSPEKVWTLRWRSTLTNASSHDLTLSNPGTYGLEGMHYGGLTFRGTRDFFDSYLDSTLKITAGNFGDPDGVNAPFKGGEQANGACADWVEFRGQFDGSLRHLHIRFANHTGPLRWFVLPKMEMVCFSPHATSSLDLPRGEALELDHSLSFACAPGSLRVRSFVDQNQA